MEIKQLNSEISPSLQKVMDELERSLDIGCFMLGIPKKYFGSTFPQSSKANTYTPTEFQTTRKE